MNFRSNITPKVSDIIGTYKMTNSTAFDFLNSIARNQVNGFWLSTAVNAHLYYKNAYFAYIIFHAGEFEFNQKFNGRIHTETVDKSNYLFRKHLEELAVKHNLVATRIVLFDRMDMLRIRKGAPKAFYDDLLNLIIQVYDDSFKKQLKSM